MEDMQKSLHLIFWLQRADPSPLKGHCRERQVAGSRKNPRMPEISSEDSD